MGGAVGDYRSGVVNGQQHNVYVVRVPGDYQLRGHWEASVTDPDAHVGGEQEPGDPTGRVREALQAAGIACD